MGRGHGGEGGAELRADGAQGGELRAGARRDGRHPLRALDAPRMVQGRRRPPLPPPGPMVFIPSPSSSDLVCYYSLAFSISALVFYHYIDCSFSPLLGFLIWACNPVLTANCPICFASAKLRDEFVEAKCICSILFHWRKWFSLYSLSEDSVQEQGGLEIAC